MNDYPLSEDLKCEFRDVRIDEMFEFYQFDTSQFGELNKEIEYKFDYYFNNSYVAGNNNIELRMSSPKISSAQLVTPNKTINCSIGEKIDEYGRKKTMHRI